MTDPYKLLEVPRDAGAADIKRAYRRLAKAMHPDSGGSAEKFAQLTKAYKLLIHPARRKRYDQEGWTEEPDVEGKFEAEAMQVIAMTMGQILSGPYDPWQMDFVGTIAANISNNSNQLSQQVRTLKTVIDRIDRSRSRVTVKKDQNNVIHQLMDGQKAFAEQALRNCERAIKVHQRAIEIVQSHTFRQDVRGTMGISQVHMGNVFFQSTTG